MKCSAPDCPFPPVHRHHWVPKRRIKSRHATLSSNHRHGGPKPWSLSEALADPRNLSPLCFYCHGQFEQKILRLDPPESAYEFAKEYGLEWSLEKDEVRGRERIGEPVNKLQGARDLFVSDVRPVPETARV